MTKPVENQRIEKTIEITKDFYVATAQAAYLLSEVEFDRMKVGRPWAIELNIALVILELGNILNFSPRLYDKGLVAITTGERIYSLALLAVIILLFIVGALLPNRKRETLKKIEAHFGSVPQTSHMMERSKK